MDLFMSKKTNLRGQEERPENDKSGITGLLPNEAGWLRDA